MTCIVGYLDKITNTVTIGADSAGLSGSNLTVRKDVKIFRNKDFVIGCTSSFRMIQLLRFKFIPPSINDKDIYEYLCTDFVDEVRIVFKAGGFAEIDKSVDSGGTFLVAYKDRLFTIGDDFQVAENINGLDACGCGANYALGALYILDNIKMTSKEKIIRSLKSAAFYSASVCEPFHLITTV